MRFLNLLLWFLSLSYAQFMLKLVSGASMSQIEKALETSFFKLWFFKHNFTNFSSLKFDMELSLSNDGSATQEGLERIFYKMVRGINVTMVVFGGSCSRGAELGCLSSFCTYHYALGAWWNSVIAPITGSFLKRKVLAVGGTGSTYYGHCWEEYIIPNYEIDIVLWEFCINDPDSYDYGRGLEKLVRSILLYKSKPALIFVQFFSSSILTIDGGNVLTPTWEYKLSTIATLSQHYKFTTIDLLSSVANRVNDTSNKRLFLSEMFNGDHPSHLAHAQTAFILLTYVRKNFLYNLKNKIKGGVLKPAQLNNNFIKKKMFPKKLTTALDVPSICWTAVLPDFRFIIRHDLYNLTVLLNSGFIKHKRHLWKQADAIRHDVRGGYFAYHSNSTLSLKFNIEGKIERNIYIAVSHQQNGGLTVFTISNLSGLNHNKVLIDCSRHSFKAMDVHPLGRFPAGKTTINVFTITGGCELNAIIIE
ncbi:uncharacterized protein LOC124812019 [Hydra vulgaris]|uniref:uncharacterized protein LOC124812019 n=1 Tax=Hydra vulgaris TaxID=6087 RepID=UPI001F5FA163|nr:uncharacterized protein LOC124812019 [Hydra vulgaris]